MATVEELRAWCEKSRLLLKTTRKIVGGDTKRSKALQGHLDKITELLPTILTWKPKLYREFYDEYLRLGQRMEDLAAENRKKSRDNKNTAQDDLNRDFGLLEDKLRQAAKDMAEDRRRQEALVQARAAYGQDHQKAVEAIELLKVLPKGNPVNVQRELDSIHQGAGQDTVDAYGVARKALKELMPRIAKEREKAEKLRQDELAQWEKRPFAEKKLDEARARLKEIQDLVGVEPRLQAFRDILQEAQKLAATGAWIQVVSTLEKLDKLPDDKALRKESESQVRTLSELPRFTEGAGYVRQLQALVSPEEGAEYHTGYQAVATLLLKQSTLKQESLKTLSDAVDNLQSELRLKEGLVSALDDQSRALTNLMGELRELAGPLDLLKEQTAFDNYAALRAGKRLQAAWTLGETLQEELEATLPTRRQAREDWQKRRSIAANVDKQLERLANSPCSEVASRVPFVRGWVAPGLTQKLEEARDYTRLVEGLAKARTELQELTRKHEAHQALDGPRGQADTAIDEAVKALTPLLAQLDKASNQAQAQQGQALFDTTKHLRADIETIRALWARSRAAATDAKALEAARDEALRGLKVIEEDVKAATSPQGLQRLALGRQRELAGQAFNEKWPEFERLQREAQALDNETAVKLAGRGEQLQARAPVDWIAGLQQLESLIEEAKGAVVQAGNARRALQGRVQQLAEDVRLEIERVRKATKNRKTFAEAFKALEDEHAQLLLQGGSTNVEALLDAEQGLQALKVRATRFAPPEGDTSGQSIDKVMETLEQAEALLEKAAKKLEDNHPKGLVSLTQRLALLKTEVYAAEPAQGFEKVAAFTKALTEAETAADKVVQVRNELAQLLPTVETAFDTFKDRKVAPEYAKQLEGRLKEVRKQRSDPTKLYQALTSLKSIDTELQAASATLQVAMDKEKGVRDAQHQDEVTLKLYERTLKICEDRWMPEARIAVKDSGGDKALPLELERMLGAARVTKKQGDVKRALHQVEMTVERAQQIIADPFGPAIGSRNNLPKDNQVWREALAAFEQSLDVVRDKTLQLAPQAHATVRNRLQQLLDGLKSKFDPNHFEAALRAVADPRANDGQRRAAREAALARVRGVQAALATNPQVKLLLQNPAAGKEFSLSYRRLQSALTRLDANVSRCVR